MNLPYPDPKAEGNTSNHNLYINTDEFIANHWGGMSNDDITRVCEKILNQAVHRWWAGVKLDIDQWRQVMGLDHDSLEAEGSVHLAEDLILTMTLGEKFYVQVAAESVPGLYADFFGKEIPLKAAVPGPFQSISGDRRKIKLWQPEKIDSIQQTVAACAVPDDRGRWQAPGPYVPSRRRPRN